MEHAVSGWKKDRFRPQDKYHKPKVVKIPDEFSLAQYLPKVGDQDGIGACTGFGIGGMSCVEAAKIGIIQPNEDMYFSQNWLYNLGRWKEGTLSTDCGAYPGDIFDVLDDYGYVLYKDWPFENKLDTTNPMLKKRYAIKYPNFVAIRVDNGAQGIISAIADGHSVAIGTPWPESWMSYSQGCLPEINENTIICGGHETFLYGYDNINKVFYGQNSWNTGWGLNGRYTIPMSVFEVFKEFFGGYDAQYSSFDVPIPIPQKSKCSFFIKLNEARNKKQNKIYPAT
jgi:hypothetical protein